MGRQEFSFLEVCGKGKNNLHIKLWYIYLVGIGQPLTIEVKA